MKKLMILFVFVLLGTSMTAQSMMSPGVEKIAEQDLHILEMKITKKYPNLKFSESQKQQLSAVLTERAQEVHVLRSSESITKAEWATEYEKIEKKYSSRLEAILSPEQKVVYQRKARKTLRRGN